MIFVLECQIRFLFEEWNESYKRYVEVNTAEENRIWCQEAKGAISSAERQFLLLRKS